MQLDNEQLLHLLPREAPAMTEAGLDQNLAAAEWGLLGAVGVVVTLMIPKASEYFQAFKEYGFDDAHRRAREWARLTRSTPWWTLVPLAALSAAGWATASVGLDVWSREALLLALPFVAQGGFIYAVRKLVKHVPRTIRTIDGCPCGEETLPKSPYYHDKTVIRFRNEASIDLYAYWIDFAGQPRLLPRDDPKAHPLHLPPEHQTFLPTLARHVWLVSLTGSLDDLQDDLNGSKGSCVRIFRARELPAEAVITQQYLPQRSPTPGGR